MTDTNTDTTVLTLPVLPLPDGVVLPGMVLTIALETAEARAAVEATGEDGRLLLVPRVEGRHGSVGTVASIESRGELPSGTPALVIRAESRARLRSAVVGTGDVLWLEAEAVDPPVSDEARRLGTELRATFRALFEKIGGPRLAEMLRGLDEPDALADAAGWWPDLSLARKVELLETIDVAERVAKVLDWAKEALAEAELTDKIRHEVTEGMEKSQREFLLRQQLAAIRKELGDTDEDRDDSPDAYRARIAERDVPDAVREALEREIDRLERSSEQSPEQGWIRTWVETVLDVPWNRRSQDHLDLARARAILDADHTGLDEVKERIMEDLAVRKLRADRGLDDPQTADTKTDVDLDVEPPIVRIVDLPALDGKTDERAADRRGNSTILTLVGPPGVGKTSLGESVARALGRDFVRVALGGIRDEAEIRGHRRTYVGAQPGRLVRALTDAGTMNPVILLDEIDKVGADHRGDPSAALLEVLDPAQNHTFRDHYLEIDLDLSDVVFLATANQLETIPAPLLDRMEIVTLDGYTEDEKVAIARDHLVARQRERIGLQADEVTISDDALRDVISGWTREAGVRSLERSVAKLLRKVATGIAIDGGRVDIEPATVPDLLGRRRFHDTDIADRVGVPGVATGLAVTGVGGDVLFVEVSRIPDDDNGDARSLTVTGQLGDVMKESARIALSYVRSHRAELGVADGADRGAIHVHFPAGAVPKDGPSAGITMTTALTSLLTGRKVRPEIAMTGEVTLRGRVLPVGGIKQKVLAAHRLGLTGIIIPARNEADLDDLPDSVRDELDIHLVDDVADVVRLALEPA